MSGIHLAHPAREFNGETGLQRYILFVFIKMVEKGRLAASDEEIERLVANAWIISSYWLDYLDSRQDIDKVTPERLDRGFTQVPGLFLTYGKGRPAVPPGTRSPSERKHGSKVGADVLDGFVLVPLHFALVLEHLAIQLVDQAVDGGVQVLGEVFDMDDITLEPQIDFGTLALVFLGGFLDTKYHRNIDDLVKVADDAVEFVMDILAQGLTDIDMVSGDHQIHSVDSIWQGTRGSQERDCAPCFCL